MAAPVVSQRPGLHRRPGWPLSSSTSQSPNPEVHPFSAKLVKARLVEPGARSKWADAK